MYQTRRLAVAADSDERSQSGGALVAGHGGGHVVDDHPRQRSGTWPVGGVARAARSASLAGAEGPKAPAPHATVPPGLAVAAGAIDRGAAAAAAASAGP